LSALERRGSRSNDNTLSIRDRSGAYTAEDENPPAVTSDETAS